MQKEALLKDIAENPKGHTHTFEEFQRCCTVDGELDPKVMDAHHSGGEVDLGPDTEDGPSPVYRSWLLSTWYARQSILRYEHIFGDNFVSNGGAALTEELFGDLKLPHFPRVLDIGAGLGGAAFLFEKRYGASVIGVDLSPTMVELAQERAASRNSMAAFNVGNIFETEFALETFDLVWTRDTLIHVAGKEALFKRILPWLKPGGQLIVTDYARSDGDVSEGFSNYVSDAGYDLRDLPNYTDVVRQAGFTDVVGADWTPRLVETLEGEIKNLHSRRETFLGDFTDEDFNYLIERWKRKIAWCLEGDFRAIRLSATRA